MKNNIGYTKVSITGSLIFIETEIFVFNKKPFLNYHGSLVWNKKISQKDKSKFLAADTSVSPTL